jgi:hypothetical protein
MSDGMRIALVGVVASLFGTLIGGGVTYAVTQSQISSQKAESRRTERLDAYSTYFGDSQKFSVEVQTLTSGNVLTAAQRAELNTFGETLIGDYARVVLLAPRHVAHLAGRLEQSNVGVWNALVSRPIKYRKYIRAAKEERSLIRLFELATRNDLGTS